MVVRGLLVEDNQVDAFFTMRQFRSLGPEAGLDWVNTVEEALVRLNGSKDYGLVLLDLGLPGISGLAAVRAMAAQAPDIPLIVLTGHDDDQTSLAALREGAQDYLVKGATTVDMLARAVRYAVERGRLQAERAALERQLAHTQRLEALGRLAGGIAHEINNRLTPIVGMAELLQARLPEGDQSRPMAASILAAAEDAALLVRKLLTYARRAPGTDRAPVDLADLVRQAAALTRATLPPAVSLIVWVPDGLPGLRGEPTPLLSVILNLLANAAAAMAGRAGTITVALAAVDRQEVAEPVNPPLIHLRYLCLTVVDEGVGMDDETRARAFDPFFTRKAVDEGTGLGLSLVHGVVLNHQGAIALDSVPGRGTTIRVFLPVSQ